MTHSVQRLNDERHTMTSWIVYIALGVADVALLGGLVIATLYLRRKHPGHVFTIWYAFWLMLTLFSGLSYYVWANEQSIPGSILSGSSLLGRFVVWFQDTSMNFRDERYLIASLYIAVLLPQLMSYVVSGIFGCANRLILVEWITAAVTWLVIKFLAVSVGRSDGPSHRRALCQPLSASCRASTEITSIHHDDIALVHHRGHFLLHLRIPFQTDACDDAQAVQAPHKLYGKLRGLSGGQRGQETTICVVAHTRA
jgi:hypothetical protein